METILSCQNINKQISIGKNKRFILKNINLRISAGEFVSIMGASGAGKSTLLYILGLMDRPDTGKLIINAMEVLSLNENELSRIRRETIGFVFQSYNLIPSLNAIDNLLLPSYIKSNKKIKAKKYEEAKELMKEIGLKEKAHQMVNELSGGEQQRIAIGRALINTPKIILMDEPTGNLDSKNATSIMELIKKINQTRKVTFLQVTHSEKFARYANRILNMSDGEIHNETKLEESET